MASGLISFGIKHLNEKYLFCFSSVFHDDGSSSSLSAGTNRQLSRLGLGCMHTRYILKLLGAKYVDVRAKYIVVIMQERWVRDEGQGDITEEKAIGLHYFLISFVLLCIVFFSRGLRRFLCNAFDLGNTVRRRGFLLSHAGLPETTT